MLEDEDKNEEMLRAAFGLAPVRVDYNPEVIQQAAKNLYARANNVIAWYAIYGLMVGIIFGIGFSFTSDLTWDWIAPIFFAFIGAAIGVGIGQDKAFEYKLRAQTALCQAQIEDNIRKMIESQFLKQRPIPMLNQSGKSDELSALRAYK